MSKQAISLGTTANDGTGDTLRSAGQKINANFDEIYSAFGTSTALSTGVTIGDSSITFEGSTPNAFETEIAVNDPTADRIIRFPDISGDVIVTNGAQTLDDKTLHHAHIDSAEVVNLQLFDFDGGNHYNVIIPTLGSDINTRFPLLSDSDTFTFNAQAQTLSNKTMYRPIIQQEISDSLGNPILELDRAGTASYIAISNANNPAIHVHSSNTNANLDLEGQGNGCVAIDKMMLKSDGEITVSAQTIESQSGFTIFEKASLPNNQTLADGHHTGEMRIFVNKGAATVTLTVTTGAAVSSVSMPTSAGFQAIWDNDGGGADGKWYIIGNNGCTITP
jgi:hypothetical protein